MAKRPITDTPTIPTKDRGSHRGRRTEHEEVAPARRPARPKGPPVKQRRNGKDSPRGSNAARDEKNTRSTTQRRAAPRSGGRRRPAAYPPAPRSRRIAPDPITRPHEEGHSLGSGPALNEGLGTVAPVDAHTRRDTPRGTACKSSGRSTWFVKGPFIPKGCRVRPRSATETFVDPGRVYKAASTTPTHVCAHGSAHTRQGATRQRM